MPHSLKQKTWFFGQAFDYFHATVRLDQKRKEHKFRSQLWSWLSSAAPSWRHRWMTFYVTMVQWQIATQIWVGSGWVRPWSNQGFKRQNLIFIYELLWFKRECACMVTCTWLSATIDWNLSFLYFLLLSQLSIVWLLIEKVFYQLELWRELLRETGDPPVTVLPVLSWYKNRKGLQM